MADVKKANAVRNALSCKAIHGLDSTKGWDDFFEQSWCDECPYCCGKPLDCDMTELLDDAANVMGELINENMALQKQLKTLKDR